METWFDPRQLQGLLYVTLAMLLGAAIGLERELEDKPAGLRTHMLVAGASSLFITLSIVIVQHFEFVLGPEVVSADPTRGVLAVASGVSFLGAGTIIHRSVSGTPDQQRVEGLTTAASILFASAVGVSVALGQLMLAVGATTVVLLTLRGVGILENRLARRRRH